MTQRLVYLETYGCQMNEYDSELVRTILKQHSYQFVDDLSQADVVMLNTCSVRDNANRKIYNRVHQVRQLSRRPRVYVGILGCMATNFRKQLLDDHKLKIDFIAGPDSYKQLPRLIEDLCDTGEKRFDVTLSELETYSDVYPTRAEGVNAWIAIMRGCNNYCTFCVVPFTRGRERSRDPENIVEEVKRLVAAGFSQVTLLGQNVNSYRYDEYDFAALVKMVSDVPGVKRIRFTSPHPKDFPMHLLKLMAERDNICKQIHLPLQAGNSRVLDKMNRTYSKEECLQLVDAIRKLMPSVSLTTDIIVGFPTETAEEFLDTVDVVNRVRFEAAFIFKYSERPNTLASRRFPDDVSEAEKKRRIMILNSLQDSISLSEHQKLMGTTQRVLVEKVGTKKSLTEIQTRTDGGVIVILPPGKQKPGEILDVCITDATRNVMKGEALVTTPA